MRLYSINMKTAEFCQINIYIYIYIKKTRIYCVQKTLCPTSMCLSFFPYSTSCLFFYYALYDSMEAFFFQFVHSSVHLSVRSSALFHFWMLLQVVDTRSWIWEKAKVGPSFSIRKHLDIQVGQYTTHSMKSTKM
jgi:hypothetical protein